MRYNCPPEATKQFNELVIPAFEHTSTFLLPPGSISKIGEYFNLDEWASYIGFECKGANAVELALTFGYPLFNNRGFYDVLEKVSGLFFLFGHGWWEFYSSQEELLSRIHNLIPCQEIELPSSIVKCTT